MTAHGFINSSLFFQIPFKEGIQASNPDALLNIWINGGIAVSAAIMIEIEKF